MGCPVKGDKGEGEAPTTTAAPPLSQPVQSLPPAGGGGGWFSSWWGSPRTIEQVKEQQHEAEGGKACGCPSTSSSSQAPSSGGAGGGGLNPLNNERQYPQVAQSSQRVHLSTERQVSSIPKGDFTPKHQPTDAEKWVYPSEQQYYNAMKSKGFSPREEDVGVILAIHNAVNEQGWKEIIKWEEEFGGGKPKLKRFMGRPKDLSPKARLMWLMGYNLPFDRHDWFVERVDGQEVRYVIDFYTGAPTRDKPVSMHLDVRPALDTFDALQNRVIRQFRETLAATTTATPASTAVGATGGPPPPAAEQQKQAGLSAAK